MNTPRLQNSYILSVIDELDRLRSNGTLADTYPRTIARLRADARRQILAAHGQAIEQFAPEWHALGLKHDGDLARFQAREESFLGRALNVASLCPTRGLTPTIQHLRTAPFSPRLRKEALHRKHALEHGILYDRQRQHAERTAKPYRELLAMDLTQYARDFLNEHRPRLSSDHLTRRVALQQISRDLDPLTQRTLKHVARPGPSSSHEPDFD